MDAMADKKTLQLISWNVNGIRAAHRKGFMDWFAAVQPDILALQEVRATPDQLPKDMRVIADYQSYWFPAEKKKGYSGVGLLTRKQPLAVHNGLGQPEFDSEGRVLIAEYEEFVLLNAYFPSGTSGQERIDYKLAFNEAFLSVAEDYRARGHHVIFCGDVNIAHNPIDLTNPKANEKNSGFLPIEREWMDRVMGLGYIDTFRHFYPDAEGKYSWWSQRSNAREKNVGWRLDYIITSSGMESLLQEASILNEVDGSDHCPVTLRFGVPIVN